MLGCCESIRVTSGWVTVSLAGILTSQVGSLLGLALLQVWVLSWLTVFSAGCVCSLDFAVSHRPQLRDRVAWLHCSNWRRNQCQVGDFTWHAHQLCWFTVRLEHVPAAPPYGLAFCRWPTQGVSQVANRPSGLSILSCAFCVPIQLTVCAAMM